MRLMQRINRQKQTQKPSDDAKHLQQEERRQGKATMRAEQASQITAQA